MAPTETATVSAPPLADFNRRHGAADELPLTPLTDSDPPPAGVASYGDVEAEVAALRRAAGLVDRSPVGRLELTGEDRARFLHGLVSCEVKRLAEGAGAHGFVTDVKGRLFAEVAVLARPGALWLELPPGRGPAVADHLGRYKIADRVEIAPLAAVPLAVAGPRAAEVLAAAGLQAPPESEPEWTSAAGELAGSAATVVRQGLVGVPAWTVWVPAEAAGAAAEALLRAGGGAGLVPVGWQAMETVRVEAGVPRWGIDYGTDHFPQETGLAGSVSYEKGCYLGQEVVARIHYRGGVNRHLRGLVFAAAEAVAPGTPLLADGRPAGVAGTVVRSPALGAWAGLAVLHKRAAEPGTRLEVEGGGSAEVRALPLVGW